MSSRTQKWMTIILCVSVLCSLFFSLAASAQADTVSVSYAVRLQDGDWQSAKYDGETAGTVGQSRGLEAITVSLPDSEALSIRYQAHVQSTGWQDWCANGETAGTEGKGKRLEAVRILLDTSDEYTVSYRAHVENIGWQDWVTDGEIAGTEGQGLRLEAIEIKLVSKVKKAAIYLDDPAYGSAIILDRNTGLSVNGWKMANVSDTHLSVYLDGAPVADTDIERHERPDVYENIKNYGTAAQNPSPGFSVALKRDAIPDGTHRLDVKVCLGNEVLRSVSLIFATLLDPQISYQVHMQDFGWLPAASDGETAGFAGAAKRMESLILNTPNDLGIRFSYQAHIQNIGWQDWKAAGQVAGTEGQSLRLEAFRIHVDNLVGGYIMYRAFIESSGWQEWRHSDEVAGTEGRSLRIEAIEIKFVKGDFKSFSLSVNTSGETVNLYQKSGKRYLYIPRLLDITKLTIQFTGDVVGASYGTFDPDAKTISGDFSETEELTVMLASGEEIPVTVFQSDVPALFIDLKNGVTLETVNAGKKDAKYASRLQVAGADDIACDISDEEVEFKGRGNTTWGFPKKPYQIKLSKKANMLNIGQGKSKKWVLLANYFDPTLLKNKFQNDMCVASGLSGIPNSAFVDLYVNGDYIGNYMLCDKIEADKSRVNLTQRDGVLVELDDVYYYEEEFNFCSPVSDRHFAVKDFSDSDLPNDEKQAYTDQFRDALTKLEADLKYGAPWEEIAPQIDVDSFAKYYLITEFAENNDSYYSSTFFYKDGADDVIHMGPTWDYDASYGFFGTTKFGADPYADFTLDYAHDNIMQYLFRYAPFEAAVDRVYQSTLRPLMDAIDVEAMRASIQKSSRMNTIAWYEDGVYQKSLQKLFSVGMPVVIDTERVYENTIDRLTQFVAGRKEHFGDTYAHRILYASHIQNIGTERSKADGAVSGTEGQSLRLESLRIVPATPLDENLSVSYRAHVQNIGWQDWVTDGGIAGTEGKSLRLEAVEIKLSDNDRYSIRYRVHVQNIGWQDWKYDGETAGTERQSLRIEAIQIELVEK